MSNWLCDVNLGPLKVVVSKKLTELESVVYFNLMEGLKVFKILKNEINSSSE